MIVRSLDGVIGSAHDVTGPGWNSRRLLTAKDGMGYTMTDTLIFAGAEMTVWGAWIFGPAALSATLLSRRKVA